MERRWLDLAERGTEDVYLTSSLCLSPFRSGGKLNTQTWSNFFCWVRTRVARWVAGDKGQPTS